MEHFGLTESQASDPLNKIILMIIKERAEINTKIYRELFGCYPDDQIKTLKEVSAFRKNPSKEQYEKKAKSIIGNAVLWPLHFL